MTTPKKAKIAVYPIFSADLIAALFFVVCTPFDRSVLTLAGALLPAGHVRLKAVSALKSFEIANLFNN
jgi:hypothetical protein